MNVSLDRKPFMRIAHERERVAGINQEAICIQEGSDGLSGELTPCGMTQSTEQALADCCSGLPGLPWLQNAGLVYSSAIGTEQCFLVHGK